MARGFLGFWHRRAESILVMVALSLCLCAAQISTFAYAEPADSKTPDVGPAPFSTPQNSPPTPQTGPDARAVWRELPPAFRGTDPPGILLYDNGAPLDDFGNPASQLSETTAPWGFSAAAADDFQIDDGLSPNTAAHISTVRVAFHFYQTGAGSATPTTTWTNGAIVTIYENAGGNVPSGQPDNMGGHTGIVAATQQVPKEALLNQMLVNECRTAWMIDIPVDFYVAKNHRYWISVVPRYAAPPQTAWMISSEANATTHIGKVFFPLVGINSWTDNPGNLGFCVGQMAPPANSRRDLSFVLYGEKTVTNIGACCNTSTGNCTTVPDAAQCTAPFEVFNIGTICSLLNPPCAPVTGACCNDVDGMCNNSVNIADCQGMDLRFEPDQLCSGLAPPCGDTTPGACCLPDGTCQNLPVIDCNNLNGAWNPGDCSTHQCPPINDECQFKLTITSGFSPFSTLGAITNGPPDGGPGCPNITNDIWYAYTADCTGTLHISLCDATDFDSAMAVYEGCFCPPVLGPRLACDNDGCMAAGGASKLSLPVTNGVCYLIRIGGVAGATGSGNLQIDCIPAGQGACCHDDHTCEVLPAASCITPDVFTPNEPCSPATCPPPENDPCDGAFPLSDGITPFVSNGATTDGPADTPDPPCALITNDVWYQYTATCDGEATISLCVSGFDTAMAVYGDCACPVSTAPVACDNDGCLASGPSTVTFAAVMDSCYLVRIGGVAGATGTGEIDVLCSPYGACCFEDGHCEVLSEFMCAAAFGAYSGPGTICEPNPCPQPLGACCHTNGTCEQNTEAECNVAGDVFTVGVPCSPNPCEGPHGNCAPIPKNSFPPVPPTANAHSGHGVAISGNTAVVGAPGEDSGRGAAYVYVYSGVSWSLQQRITGSDLIADSSFGEYVAIDGDTIVVGADNMSGGGAAYVFTRTGLVWTEAQKLVSSQPSPSLFGASVAIDGDWILIGAYASEHAIFFHLDAGIWTEFQTVTRPDGAATAYFGYAAELNGNYALIGAPQDDLAASNQGAAYVYFYDGAAWEHQETLLATLSPTTTGFGTALALDGDTAAVSSITSPQRMAYIYRRSGTSWSLEQQINTGLPISNPPTALAPFIDLSGNALVVGSDSYSVGLTNRGAARFYRRLGATWVMTSVPWTGAAAQDRFGWSVALDGNKLVIGAYLRDTPVADCGAAYFYDLNCQAACCLITGVCQLITEPNCAITSGTYLGIGTKCGPNPCPQPIGACCTTGNCEILTEVECNGSKGTFQGPDTVCSPNPCVQPSGACCMPDGSCQELDSLFCDLAGGVHQGGGTSCASTTCPPPASCCPGDMEDDGDIDLIDLTALIDAVLSPPVPADPSFCRADVNDDDSVNGLDLNAFIMLISDGYHACATCPIGCPPIFCCPGDANSDGIINGTDINEFIVQLLANPPLGSLELCVTDVIADAVLDFADVDALVTKLLAGDVCP